MPAVGLIPGAVGVTASGVDGFYGGPLGPLLRRDGVDQLLLAGFGLEATVHSTMRTANDAGLECLAVVDACVALDPELTPRTVSMIEMSGGIFGAVGAPPPCSTPSPPLPLPRRLTLTEQPTDRLPTDRPAHRLPCPPTALPNSRRRDPT